MNKPFNRITLIAGVLLSAALSSPTFAAEPMLSTGGYAAKFYNMEVMKMLDADGHHKATKDEFIAYQDTRFTAMDKSADK